MSICLTFDKFSLDAHRRLVAQLRPGRVSLVVCPLSGTPTRLPLCGSLWVYSLSHDFAVKCLQNVWLRAEARRVGVGVGVGAWLGT